MFHEVLHVLTHAIPTGRASPRPESYGCMAGPTDVEQSRQFCCVVAANSLGAPPNSGVAPPCPIKVFFRMSLRNIAIIAHVDHGTTPLFYQPRSEQHTSELQSPMRT